MMVINCKICYHGEINLLKCDWKSRMVDYLTFLINYNIIY